MKYALNADNTKRHASSTLGSVKGLLGLLKGEYARLWGALGFITVTTAINLLAPLAIARAIDRYIPDGNYHAVVLIAIFLLALYIVGLVTQYVQIRLMGGVGQRLLFTLRNALFGKLQSLPIAFFAQNKAGDLISRLNNDTEKLNIFFSQSLMQFVGSIMVMIGAAIFMLSIDVELGLIALIPAAVVLIITRFSSAWLRRVNRANLTSTGMLSAEIQESLEHFKVIVAFNRRDYFRRKFDVVNVASYDKAVSAGIANNALIPIYGAAAQAAQIAVLVWGVSLIAHGGFSIGLLISMIAYVTSFYTPLRQLAAMWSSFQTALAGWDRIEAILDMQNDMPALVSEDVHVAGPLIEFKDVSFGYADKSNLVLQHIDLTLEQGKTYAFVGPTGGGKSTTASLIARLYDPTTGTVLLDGRDIRSVGAEERTARIGFILQDPLLFSGTVRDNILYGNEGYKDQTDEMLAGIIKDAGLDTLLERFDEGLATAVNASGGGLSLGQKQLIAFMRAVLRKPDLLILDEATANIDTVTEQLLDDILAHLSKETTLVIIAHRLNTIARADEIFFVNGGSVDAAGSMEHAVEMLMKGNRTS